MDCSHGRGELRDDDPDFRAGQRDLSLGVFFEQLAVRPLKSQIMEPIGNADVERSDDVGVNNPTAKLGFPGEAGNSGTLVSELLTEQLERNRSKLRMLRSIYDCGAPFADELSERVASDVATDEILLRHDGEPNVAALGQQATFVFPRPNGYSMRVGNCETIGTQMTLSQLFRRTLAVSLSVFGASACASGRGAGPGAPAGGGGRPVTLGPPAAANAPRGNPQQPDGVSLYRRLGLLAEGGETPFVGSLSFLGGRTADSTLMLLTVALPNRSLRFSREGDRFRANYSVSLEVRRGSDRISLTRRDETVRVLTFRETQRADESVLFTQPIYLSPGQYDLRLGVKGDSVSVGSAIEATIGVPRFAEGAISSPVAYYDATPRTTRQTKPEIVATPRSTVVFGRDSILPFYLEGYGSGDSFSVFVAARPDGGTGILWSDTISLAKQQDLFSGTIGIPISRVGVGIVNVIASRIGGTDTLRAPLLVAFGEDLPVATFSEMLDYLRYFAPSSRLQEMRNADVERRADLWAAFLKETDPNPQTPEHEGLRQYFGRINQANARFRQDGAIGWLTDRGRVFVALGSPDQIIEPNISDPSRRNRTQVWEYREHRFSVIFEDQTGFDRWEMSVAAEAEFEALARRLMVQ